MGYISLFDSFKYISEVGIACPIQKFVFTIKRKILISILKTLVSRTLINKYTSDEYVLSISVNQIRYELKQIKK